MSAVYLFNLFPFDKESIVKISVSDPVGFRPDPDPRFKKKTGSGILDLGSGSFKFCESILLVKGPAKLDSTM